MYTCIKCHRTSNASDCNNLQCPHCGGNMIDAPAQGMSESDVRSLAMELMTKHGLVNWDKPWTVWTFNLDRAKTRAGLCDYRRRSIYLSKHYIRLNSHEDIRNTILHEIAHALAPTDGGHGILWRSMAARIGARPQRCAASHTVMPDGRIMGTCECGQKHSMHRMPKRRYTCRNCHKLVVWSVRP